MNLWNLPIELRQYIIQLSRANPGVNKSLHVNSIVPVERNTNLVHGYRFISVKRHDEASRMFGSFSEKNIFFKYLSEIDATLSLGLKTIRTIWLGYIVFCLDSYMSFLLLVFLPQKIVFQIAITEVILLR